MTEYVVLGKSSRWDNWRIMNFSARKPIEANNPGEAVNKAQGSPRRVSSRSSYKKVDSGSYRYIAVPFKYFNKVKRR